MLAPLTPHKRLLLLWRAPDEPWERCSTRLTSECAEGALAAGPDGLILSLASEPRGNRAPRREDGARLAALVSVWSRDPEVLARVATAFAAGGAALGSYEVSEHVALEDPQRLGDDGSTTAGVKQVTLLRRKPGLSDAQFLHAWHQVHTPLALRVHPLWAYHRHVVVGRSPGAPEYEGIVELMFRSHEDLHDPARFFGGEHGADEIMADVAQWIDLERIEFFAMSERVLRRPRLV